MLSFFSNYLNARVISISVQEFPPYVIVKNGKVSGVLVDVLNEVKKQKKFDFLIGLYPNRRSKVVVKRGEMDAIFPLGWNKQRDSWLYWSIPLVAVKYGFLQTQKVVLNLLQ